MNSKNVYIRLHVEPNAEKRGVAWFLFGTKYRKDDVDLEKRMIRNVFATRLSPVGLEMVKNMINYNEEVDYEYAVGIDSCLILLIESDNVITGKNELDKYKVNCGNKSKYYDQHEVFVKDGKILDIFNVRQRSEVSEIKEWIRLCVMVKKFGINASCLFFQDFFREKGIAVHPKYGYPMWWEEKIKKEVEENGKR